MNQTKLIIIFEIEFFFFFFLIVLYSTRYEKEFQKNHEIATQLFLRSIVKRSFAISKYGYCNAFGNNIDYLAVHHPREIDFILGNVTRS